MLTLIKQFEFNKSKSYYKCDCGQILIVANNDVQKNYMTDCGCNFTPTSKALNSFNNFLNPTKLTLLCICGTTTNKIKHSIWKMQCYCGNMFAARGFNVKSGDTISCGCYHNKSHSLQGGLLSKFPKEYSSYNSMIARCVDTRHVSYGNYGGDGITVDDTWLRSNDGFINFMTDMGTMPIDNIYSIERLDNLLGYNKSNCIWLPLDQQYINRSTNKLSFEKADEIRKMYATKQYTQKELSEIFDTCISNISMVINNKLWVLK